MAILGVAEADAMVPGRSAIQLGAGLAGAPIILTRMDGQGAVVELGLRLARGCARVLRGHWMEAARFMSMQEARQ